MLSCSQLSQPDPRKLIVYQNFAADLCQWPPLRVRRAQEYTVPPAEYSFGVRLQLAPTGVRDEAASLAAAAYHAANAVSAAEPSSVAWAGR